MISAIMPKSVKFLPDFADRYDYNFVSCTIELSRTKPMSRQAGPSIVLSVLIVCFFAIALFQRDEPRTRLKRTRSTEKTRARGAMPLPVTDTRSKQSRKQERPIGGVKPGESSALAATDSVSPRRDQRASGSRSSRAFAHVRGESEPERQPGLNLPASPRGPQRGQAVEPRRTGQAIGRAPRTAFTITLPSETVEDVCVRVYGTKDLADSLWRSNRDTLPRRDSPLAAGTLLRTPELR